MTLPNGVHCYIKDGKIVEGADYEKWYSSKALDNSENNNKINKEKIKKGENNDGRQEQSNKEKQSEERRKRIREALARIREIGGGVDGGGHDGNVPVFNKRRGGKGLANGLVDYHIETPDKIKSIFEGAGISTPSYNKLKLNNQQSIDTFKKAIAKAKQSLGNDGASVELKDDYTDINLYLSEDGESGFGIKPNGDIVSVFSSKKVKGRAHHLLEMAVYEGGGRQLDCFDIYLTKIYETHGFKPVAKMKWNDEYIPEGWNKENFKDYNNGEPDVVFMVYAPNNTKKDIKIPYIYDYDDGDKIQQKYFAKNKVDSLIDAKKKEFKESDVNRDEDGKFATKNSSNKSKDATSGQTTKNKDKKDGLDYGDLPKELHEPFKRLNTVKKAGEYIFNKNNEYKITEKDIKKKTDTYRKREKPDWVYVNLHNYYEIDDIGEHIGEPMNLTNRDNLKSDIEKFLFDFSCGSDEAKEKWGEKFESEIKPKLKQMIKNAPIPKGTLYRAETWTHGRDVEVGKSINFDCRSSADDNMGYEVAVDFSQEDYEAGEEIYIFEFPEGTNALNIQGVSTYINEHEYLVDGDFIIESIEEDEYGYKQVKLVRPEDYEPPEPEEEDEEDEEEDGILDLRKYNEDEDEDDDDNYSPFGNFDPNWKPNPYGSDDDY